MNHAEAISILGLTAHEATSMRDTQRRTPEDGHIGPWRMTPLQVRVMDMTVEGACTKQIAHALNVVPTTISGHMVRIYERMGTSTITRSAVLYDRWKREERGRALLTERRAP